MKNNNKNYILTIETTSEICGVSIVIDNKVLYENNIDIGLNHSVTLFDNIYNSLKKIGITMYNIDTIKISNGPGSFTGIRIGIAAGLGLSKLYNNKIEYVDTLDSLAHNIRLKSKKTYKTQDNIKVNNNLYVLSLIDAKVDRVYSALYNYNNLNKLSCDTIINVYDLCNILNKYFISSNIIFFLIGNGYLKYKDIFKDELKIKYKTFENISLLNASSLAFTNGKISSIPYTNYLMASKAERDRQNNI